MNTVYCTVYCTVHCTVNCTALFSVQEHCIFCVVNDMMRGESFRWRRIDTGSLLHSRNVWNFELHTARWTQHIIADCTMYTDLHTVTNIIQTAHWPAHFTQNTAHMPHCTLHTDLHTSHRTQHTCHTVHCTLTCTQHTEHRTLHTIIFAHLAWWYPCDNHWLAQTMFLILDLHCTEPTQI